MSASGSLGHNKNIHGLRGLAALMVFLFHVYDMSATAGVLHEPPLLGQILLEMLSGGVELFFMISGYLITGSLIRHGNIRNFLVDRAIRIYPVFLALHVPLFIAGPYLGYKWMVGISLTDWLQAFMANALFLPGVLDLPLLQLNAWSLSYEAAFYMLSAFIYFLCARQFSTWRLALSVALVAGAILLYPAAIFFLVGALVFRLLHGQPPRFIQFSGLLVLLALFSLLLLHGVVAATDTGGRGAVGGLTIRHLYLIAALPGFVLFYALTKGQSICDRVLQHRVAQYLGDISYSFYLIHPVVMFPLRLIVTKILIGKLGLPVWLCVAFFGITGLIGTLIAATISYRLLEKRLAKWLKQKLHRLPDPALLPTA